MFHSLIVISTITSFFFFFLIVKYINNKNKKSGEVGGLAWTNENFYVTILHNTGRSARAREDVSARNYLWAVGFPLPISSYFFFIRKKGGKNFNNNKKNRWFFISTELPVNTSDIVINFVLFSLFSPILFIEKASTQTPNSH